MIDLPPPIYNFLQRFVHGEYERQGEVISALDLPEGARVIELGCGTGLFSKFFKPGTYVGVDFDASRIETARKTYPEHTFLVGDTTVMTGDRLAEFDMAMCHGFIHHVDDEGVGRMVDAFRAAARKRSKPFSFLAIEPVLPATIISNPVGYLLAKCDRGEYVRTIPELKKLFGPAITKIEPLRTPVQWPVPGAAVHLRYAD